MIRKLLLGILFFEVISSLPAFSQTAEKELEFLARELETLKSIYSQDLASSRFIDTGAVLQGRLTPTPTTSGINTPVPTSDVSTVSTIYFTPYKGNRLGLYDINTTSWQIISFTELSFALSGLSSGYNYDAFVYSNGGNAALTISQHWSGDTTRGFNLDTISGIYLASTGVTNGNHSWRYLGTFRATGASSTTDMASQRYLWNYYNRVPRSLFYQGTDPCNNSANSSVFGPFCDTSNSKVEYVTGQAEEIFRVSFISLSNLCGIGLDSTTTNSAFSTGSNQGAGGQDASFCRYSDLAGMGYHSINLLQFKDGYSGLWASDPNKGFSGLLGELGGG